MHQTSVPRIAYLEDEPETAETVCGWIKEAGLAVDLFNRGADCARAVERGQYAACLLDWLVPDMSGPEVLVRLRLQLKDACPAPVAGPQAVLARLRPLLGARRPVERLDLRR